jgi:glycerol-3-phosphate dehydrogenase
MSELETDLLVIGGGINGTGIALDAQGRGLETILCEANDLASATSSASSKLVHGGLRYLEQYEFKLVREALKEREVLLAKAPHIIQPLTFVLPHAKHLRPAWMIRIGMFLYDHLAKLKSLKKSKKISLKNSAEGQPLQDQYKVGFTYSDCRIDDARMVVLNAIQAQEKGAKILVNTKCVSAVRTNDGWHAVLENESGQVKIKCKAIVNAAGPWVAEVIHETLETNSKSHVKLIKGSHFVVPKLYEGTHAYILQNKDNRIVFALPYGFTDTEQNEFTVIGTTDVNYKGDPRSVKISDEEVDYLCELISEYFKKPINKSTILWDWAGVRPLFDDDSVDPSKVTREYMFEVEDNDGKYPVLSIFGGKITTYRTLSEGAVDKLHKYFPSMQKCTTKHESVPGGELSSQQEITDQLQKSYPWLQSGLLYRYAVTYGLRVNKFLEGIISYEGLGDCFGYNLYEKELEYLYNEEWATTLESIITRRTKLILWLTDQEKNKIKNWLEDKKKS